jgi:hypothetical protein
MRSSRLPSRRASTSTRRSSQSWRRASASTAILSPLVLRIVHGGLRARRRRTPLARREARGADHRAGHGEAADRRPGGRSRHHRERPARRYERARARPRLRAADGARYPLSGPAGPRRQDRQVPQLGPQHHEAAGAGATSAEGARRRRDHRVARHRDRAAAAGRPAARAQGLPAARHHPSRRPGRQHDELPRAERVDRAERLHGPGEGAVPG